MNAAESNISASMQLNRVLGNCGGANFGDLDRDRSFRALCESSVLRSSLHMLKPAKTKCHIEGTVLNFGGLGAGQRIVHEVAEADTWQRKSRPCGKVGLPICLLKPCLVVTRSLNAEARHPAQKRFNVVLAHHFPHFCNGLMKMADLLSACLKLPNSLFNFDPSLI